jgi:hypothetical protein
MWIKQNRNRILYRMVNVNANVNMKVANGSEKYYSTNKMAVLVLVLC